MVLQDTHAYCLTETMRLVLEALAKAQPGAIAGSDAIESTAIEFCYARSSHNSHAQCLFFASVLTLTKY